MLRAPWRVELGSDRRHSPVDLAGWLVVIGMATLALTQVFGWTGVPVVYAAQAATPYLLTPSVPLAMIAARYERHALAIVCALVATALLWLTMPVVFHADGARPAANGVQLTIAHSNVYIDNPEPEVAATTLIDMDADVIAVTEYSRSVSAALHAQGIDSSHPFSIEDASGNRSGVALFSRYPLQGEVLLFGHQSGIDATVDVHGTPIRIMVVHPLPALDRSDLQQWRSDLPIIGEHALQGGPPTVVLGDFNASRWHPGFRDLLDRGLTDAHEQLGHGFSVSWPADWTLPPFVRLDHALMTAGLVATGIDDVTMPGSDHRAFVVTIATT